MLVDQWLARTQLVRQTICLSLMQADEAEATCLPA